MNDLTIWVTYHDSSQINQYHLKENATVRLFKANDISVDGLNINCLNPFYSEIVTLYWVWKNHVESSRVGFCHYRRQFHQIIDLHERQCQVLAINRNIPVYTHYKSCHNYQDYDDILEILDKKFGKGNKYSKYLLESRIFIPFCCFIMYWSDFISLCNFLFSILDAYDRKNELKMTPALYQAKAEHDFRYDNVNYQRRAISFLAERLISCYIVCELEPLCLSGLF